MMKKRFRVLLLVIGAAFALALPLCAQTEDENGFKPYAVFTVEGPSGSSVSYPLLTENSLAADTINRQVMAEAHIDDYIALMGRISESGTGLKVTCGTVCGNTTYSVVITAEGKMLSGPPAKIYYPMTFDRRTGERLAPEALFSDPARAKEIIESLIACDIEPQLSDYSENNGLFPVPYDRYALDGQGHITFYYEKRQFSFLSDDPGAITFRYSELWDALDTSPDSPCMDAQLDGLADQYPQTRGEGFSPADALYRQSESGFMGGITLVRVGQPLEEALQSLRATTDSGYYPGGAYYETEASALRGTLLLTDETEMSITGLLTSRVDSFGIETGSTTLENAIALLGEPSAMMELDEDTAELFLVCPGQAATWVVTLPANGEEGERAGEYTLYADAQGIIRYIKLAYNNGTVN